MLDRTPNLCYNKWVGSAGVGPQKESRDHEILSKQKRMFFLTEHDMCRHASIACGLDMEDVKGSAIFIGTDDDFQEDVMGIEILEEDADIITFIECYDY